MKPARLALTHNLVVGYGLHKKMNVYNPRPATKEELAEFHSEDYVEFIERFVIRFGHAGVNMEAIVAKLIASCKHLLPFCHSTHDCIQPYRVTPQNYNSFSKFQTRFNIGVVWQEWNILTLIQINRF